MPRCGRPDAGLTYFFNHGSNIVLAPKFSAGMAVRSLQIQYKFLAGFGMWNKLNFRRATNKKGSAEYNATVFVFGNVNDFFIGFFFIYNKLCRRIKAVISSNTWKI